MISKEENERMKQKAMTDVAFEEKMAIAVILVQEYDDTQELGSFFTSKTDQLLTDKGWSRQTAYGFLSIIFDEYIKRGLLSDKINDELDGVATSIVGDCAAECILKFYRDPDDLAELTNYVRSGLWLKEEYYSGRIEG